MIGRYKGIELGFTVWLHAMASNVEAFLRMPSRNAFDKKGGCTTLYT
jgi:hypothetical protein